MTKAKEWHNRMKQRTQAAEESTPYTPLRLVLFQDLAHMMEDRVVKLSKAGSEDELWQTALNHGVITVEGSFPYQRWSQLQKTLVPVEEGAHPHEQDAQIHGAAQTDLNRSDSNTEVSCPETCGEPANRSLDPSNWCTTRRTPILAGAATGFDGMGTDRSNHEASHTSSEQAVSGTPTTLGEGEAQTERASVEGQGAGQTDSSTLTGTLFTASAS